jgi:hypothetical protein
VQEQSVARLLESGCQTAGGLVQMLTHEQADDAGEGAPGIRRSMIRGLEPNGCGEREQGKDDQNKSDALSQMTTSWGDGFVAARVRVLRPRLGQPPSRSRSHGQDFVAG